MTTNIIYTNIKQDTKDGKQIIYKLIKCKNATSCRDCVGRTITIRDYVIFERISDDDNRNVVFVFTDESGVYYATTSGSIINEITEYLDIAGLDEPLKVTIGSARSRTNREYLTIDIL